MFRCLSLAKIPAQDGVHETRLRSESLSPGQLDRLIHSGVVRDSREPKHLVKAESQKNLQRGLLRLARCLARDQPIERGLSAHDAVNDFLQQSAICSIKPSGVAFGLKQVLNKVPARLALLQQTKGNFSWFFKSHLLIIPFAQVSARNLIL